MLGGRLTRRHRPTKPAPHRQPLVKKHCGVSCASTPRVSSPAIASSIGSSSTASRSNTPLAKGGSRASGSASSTSTDQRRTTGWRSTSSPSSRRARTGDRTSSSSSTGCRSWSSSSRIRPPSRRTSGPPTTSSRPTRPRSRALFAYNELLVASNSVEARLGSLTSGREWFMRWRTIDGSELAPATDHPSSRSSSAAS